VPDVHGAAVLIAPPTGGNPPVSKVHVSHQWGNTVYYKSDATVSPSSYDGTLTVGQSLTISTATWFVCDPLVLGQPGFASLQVVPDSLFGISVDDWAGITVGQVPAKNSSGGVAGVSVVTPDQLAAVVDSSGTPALSSFIRFTLTGDLSAVDDITVVTNPNLAGVFDSGGVRVTSKKIEFKLAADGSLDDILVVAS
jgi:hypothetical protein